LVLEPYSLKRSLTVGEMMSRAGEEGEVPPPELDEDGNTIIVE
jgi:hypothetical protein